MNVEFNVVCPTKGPEVLESNPFLKVFFQFPRGVLPVVGNSTNPAEVES